MILPAISHEREVPRSSAVYERRFGKRSMFEIGVPRSTTRRPGDGLGDIECVKHASSRDGAPRIVSLGLETVAAERRSRKGHGTARVFEPYISAGTMLRDWYLQTQLKVELPIDRAKADRAFVYNAYLGRDTSAAPNTWTIGVELNGENHELRADAAGAKRPDGHRRAGGVDRHDGAVQQTRRTGSAMGRILALGILGTLACAQVACRTSGTASPGRSRRPRRARRRCASRSIRRCAATSCPMKRSWSMRRAVWRTPS